MNKDRSPLVSTRVVLLLVSLALLAPRLAHVGSRALCAVNSDERAMADLGYAQHRLWSDFLEERSPAGLNAARPEPTLAEYRQFLAGLGLRSRGDVISLLVVPVLEEDRLSRQIEVRLSQTPSPVVIHLYARDSLGRTHSVGHLEIREPFGATLACLAAPDAESRLLAYWPLRPVPLLP
jgi:hypothetical protein